jgi:hypothetical protein
MSGSKEKAKYVTLEWFPRHFFRIVCLLVFDVQVTEDITHHQVTKTVLDCKGLEIQQQRWLAGVQIYPQELLYNPSNDVQL